MKEDRGRRDFPVSLEETAAQGENWKSLLQGLFQFTIADGLRPSTLVILHLLLQNRTFHPTHLYSLLYILFFYTHHPLNLTFIPTIRAHFHFLFPSPTSQPPPQPPFPSLPPPHLASSTTKSMARRRIPPSSPRPSRRRGLPHPLSTGVRLPWRCGGLGGVEEAHRAPLHP
jgi:hypothetical protein